MTTQRALKFQSVSLTSSRRPSVPYPVNSLERRAPTFKYRCLGGDTESGKGERIGGGICGSGVEVGRLALPVSFFRLGFLQYHYPPQGGATTLQNLPSGSLLQRGCASCQKGLGFWAPSPAFLHPERTCRPVEWRRDWGIEWSLQGCSRDPAAGTG